ncbi:YfgG family protein [Serratia marcescens]|uniref:YfgG family protein n=1 Tax=Serratia marcescens TaxID=615 RepID=UPI00298D62CD|nr:YfgG family protein [Serratia marcescens]WPC45918.1 YfgG family protein [Serratia marcescens]
MRKKTTGQMTKIVLFISFIILVGRLLYAAVVAVPHHQEKSRPLRKTPPKSARRNRTPPLNNRRTPAVS